MRKFLFLFLFFTFSLCATETLRIAVAANVSYVIEALKEAFKKEHPGVELQIIIGSSGKLAAQIRHGAPFDLFMSADMKYPETLYKEGVATTEPVVYAQGALVYLSVKKQDFSKGVMLLKESHNRKIAIANPKTAPYGIAAAEALKNAKIYELVKDKFVYGESISQTVTYATKAADIGLIAKSSLFSPQMRKYRKGEHWSDVNETLYRPISQGVVILKHGEKRSSTKVFYAFILSQEAKDIFKAYGYGSVFRETENKR